MTFGPYNKVIDSPYNNLMMVNVQLNKYDVKQVLVDTGSSLNLLTLDVFSKLGLSKSNLAKISYLLVELGDKTMALLRNGQSLSNTKR